MYIGDIGNVSTYTTVQYGGSAYSTGNRPLERLTIDGGVVLGARQSDDELLVKGDICVYPLWIKTGDLVEMREGKLIFKGRK